MGDRKSRSFAVIGLGTFGSTVALELARFGNHVLGMDAHDRPVSDLADQLAEAVIGDGRDEQALREAGIGAYDTAVVAIGEDLEANILCTMNVKLLGVPCVWVKAMNRTHHRILSRIGADRVILPEQEIGQHVAPMLHNPAVRDYVSLGNGFHIVDFEVPESLDGKHVRDLGLAERFSLRCLGVMRGVDYISAEAGGAVLQTDDKLLLLGRRGDLRVFGDSL